MLTKMLRSIFGPKGLQELTSQERKKTLQVTKRAQKVSQWSGELIWQAIQDLQDAVKREPEEWIYHYQLGLTREDAAREALKEFEETLRSGVHHTPEREPVERRVPGVALARHLGRQASAPLRIQRSAATTSRRANNRS